MSLQVWLPLNKKGNFYNYGLLGDINVVNAPSFESSGKIGSACMTTGSFKLSAQQTSKVLNNEQFSFASWIYITQASGSTILFGNDNMYAPNNRRFTIFLYNTLQRIHLSWQNYDSNNVVNGSGTMTGDIIPINTWTHIAVTYSSSTNKATIYVNGVKSVDYTISKFTSPTYTYETILMQNSNTVYYNDYRLYDHCLSPKEIHEIAKGLVLHYPLNDQYVQSTVYDCSGYCNNGTVTGSLQVVDDSPRYKKSTKIQDTTISHPLCLNNQDQEWTCCAWVNPTSQSGNQYLNNFNLGNTIFYYGGAPLLYLNSGANDYYNYGGIKLNANEWTHIAFVFKNSTGYKHIFINGEDRTNIYGPNKTSTPAGLPSTVTLFQGFNGQVSDYREYSTALSEEDVKELYNTSAIINNNNTLLAYEFVE